MLSDNDILENQHFKKIAVLFHTAEKIEDKQIREELISISLVLKQIFDYSYKTEQHSKEAVELINAYIRSVKLITSKYTVLKKEDLLTEEIQSSITVVLSKAKKLLTKQYNNFFETELLDLETEIQLLESTFRMEGIL
jgi:hypothetical protein